MTNLDMDATIDLNETDRIVEVGDLVTLLPQFQNIHKYGSGPIVGLVLKVDESTTSNGSPKLVVKWQNNLTERQILSKFVFASTVSKVKI